MEDPEWEPHDVAPEEGGGGGGREPAASSPDEPPSSEWECNICFEALKIEESCITSCGHLYCWPCLHKWMDTFRQKTTPPVCPVCKNVLSSEKIIPIFGRGADRATDPRVRENNIPQRPAPPPREEAPPPAAGFPGFPMGGFGGINFSAGFFGPGIMAFGGNMNAGMGGGRGMAHLTPEQRRHQQFLSQIMLFLGFAVLASLLLT